MTKSEQAEYFFLFAKRFMYKKEHTVEEKLRYKELEAMDKVRAANEGHSYSSSESYMTSNIYDR